MALDVKINISSATPIGSIGFGCPLILEEKATTAKNYATYRNINEVVKAGYATTTDVYKTASLIFSQTHAPDKIAICSTTEKATAWLGVEANVSKAWRQLVTLLASEGGSTVAEIMTVIEAQTTYPKFYYANLAEDATTGITTTGVERTLLCCYEPTDDVPCPVAAIAGEVAGLTVGSYTLNNLIVKGVEPRELSESEISAIHEKGAVTIVLSAGDTVVSEGITAGKFWVDDTDGNDWIKQQLEYKLQKVLNNNLKVPYTNTGIAMLESAAVSVMSEAQTNGIVNTYEVNFLLRENTTEADRSARKYVGGNITYDMQGAIHTVEVNCECKL